MDWIITEKKQIIKITEMMRDKIEGSIKLTLYIPELIELNLEISGDDVLFLLDFITLHPSLSAKEETKSFYSFFLQKFI